MKNYMKSEAKLISSHGSPIGYNFLFNDNGYMNNAGWIIVTKQLCKGIRDFLVSLCCVYFIYSI